MSAQLAADTACTRPGCGHGEDLHDGICFGTECECVRFVGSAESLRANGGQALPWAHVMPDSDLHGFLGDLVSAAMGRWQSEPEVPDRTVLADIERVCREWRTPGEGYRSDPEPDECPCPPADQPGPHQVGCPQAEVPVVAERPVNELTQAFAPVAALREVLDGEHWPIVHHDYAKGLGRDLPELGGA
ncbi:hypothetical protein GCM10023084_02500 [Streptomyces lacrimifluminis]|uniref:hypothetical protein n=1 Tax=Streptomyces lacrimifluminis TaxID=1500077 RepID=UPI0031EC6014